MIYNLVWVLENDNGERWEERHKGITLNDFDVIYSLCKHKIICVEMGLVDE